MPFRKWIFLFTAVAESAALVACGGSSSTNAPTLPISIFFSTAAPSSLQLSATTSLAVTLMNDSTNAGVKWAVTCSNSNSAVCGSLSTTGPGASTTYTAPSALPSATSNSVTVTATSVADSTKSVSVTIPLIGPAVRLDFSPTAYPPNALQVGAQASIAVIVTNDPSNNGVSWSATCMPNAVPCGQLTPEQTYSGVPVTLVESSSGLVGKSVTVKATSVTNPGFSISIPIFISAEPTTLANGSYVFQLSGTNTGHFYSVSGVFTVNNGSITGGEQDFIDPVTGAKHDPITGGSILAVDDGNLWVTLNTADTSVGVNGVETLDATLRSPSHATLIEFDSSAGSSGTLDLQTSTAAPSGGYVFYASGRNSAKNATALAGVINVDGSGTISGNGSIFDINDSALAAPLTAQTFAASTVSAPDNQGRVQFTLVPSVASGIAQIDLVGYIVDAKHIRLVETTDVYGGFTGGIALGQTGPFTSNSISGLNFVFGAVGEDPNGVLDAAGLLMAGPNTGTSGAVTGNVTGTFSWNDHTGVPNQTPLSLAAGTYTLDTSGAGAGTGRVSLNGLTDSTTNPTFTYDLDLFLTGDGGGLLILTDHDTVLTGQGFQQTGGPFGSNSFFGPYAMNVRHVDISGNTETRQFGDGTVVADGASSLAGFFDLNANGPSTANNLPMTGSFTANPNGVFTGTLAGLDTSPNPPAHNFAFYVVSPAQVIFIETDNAQLTLGSLDQQQ
jgi:hypothetical protein